MLPSIEPVLVYCWPQLPELPAIQRAVLVRVPLPLGRMDAQQKLRSVLREVLATWSRLPPAGLPLEETGKGPQWHGLLHGETLDISVSYGSEEGWLGFVRGGRIGVDTMAVEPFVEGETVAETYLGAALALTIRAAANPALAFASAWTEREARLKCWKRGPTEWTETKTQDEARCHCQTIVLDEGTVGTVCWTPL